MPLDFKQMLFEDHREMLAEHSTKMKERFYRWYAKLEDPLAYTHLLLWAAYGSKAWKQATDMQEEVKRIEGMAEEIEMTIEHARLQAGMLSAETITGEMFRQALELIKTWNVMGLHWFRYRKANPDRKYPFVTFVPHTGFMSSLTFTIDYPCADWPLIKDWAEFFMILPTFLDNPESAQEWQLKDYAPRSFKGILNEWYMKKFGYGVDETKAGRTWGKVYEEELRTMSNDAVIEEYKKFNWGHSIVMAEKKRRRV